MNETFQLVVKPLNVKVGHNKPAIELIVHFHSKLGVTSFQPCNSELELGLKPLSAQIGAVCVLTRIEIRQEGEVILSNHGCQQPTGNVKYSDVIPCKIALDLCDR